MLIERTGTVGRGVAYADRGFPYLLNVPANRMSATSSAPNEFLDFAARRVPNVTGEDFLPRSIYGEYLEELLLSAQLSAPGRVRLETLQAEATDIRRIDRNLPLQVALAGHRTLTADDVVLALGNPKPASLPAAAGVIDHPAYIADPWAGELRFSSSEIVLLIGTGLTAADVIVAAAHDPRQAPMLHAISRHGLVPPRQTPFRPEAFRGDGEALLLAAATSLRRLTRAVRLLAQEAESCGGDWRESITFVRNMAPTIWRRLPERDRKRFLRHLRAYWDVHRHRLPPETLQVLDELRRARRLHIHAGRIERIEPRGRRLEVAWRVRGQQLTRTLTVDRVLNCTGPDYAIARSQEPLWRNLLQSRLCVPDPLGLGLRTGPNGGVIDADGWPGPHLFYLGPMLRADLWEATAVAELRVHAERLAAALAEAPG
jgi:uncharacterized NAD(P)/FAD-binding protein YdhS